LQIQEDVEKKDPRGRTPLMLAVTMGHKESVRVLLNHGASVNMENREGWNGKIKNICFKEWLSQRQILISCCRSNRHRRPRPAANGIGEERFSALLQQDWRCSRASSKAEGCARLLC
jgi:Ankyrin repeat